MKQFDIYLADLNPRRGTEAGKIRPVLVVQTDLLNGRLESTLVCPLTTQVVGIENSLRQSIKAGQCGLEKDSEIMIDQIRAMDNKRLIQHLGRLEPKEQVKVKQKIADVFDL
jgi:mRNA interferase MazF